MDASNVRKEAFEFANRLISLDPVEYDSAINQYFEADAVLDHKAIYLSGASKIKKIAYLQSLLGHESKLDQEPVYNDRDGTLAIHFRRVYKTPALGRFLSSKKVTLHYAANLQLMPDGQAEKEEEQKLYVTRVTDLARYERFPLESFVPFFLIRPVITFLALFTANAAYFWQHHKKEGPVQLLFSAAFELFGAVWGFLLAETGKRQAQADYWRAEKGAQFDRLVEQARSTASWTLNDVQYRAKKAGIPLEQYKTQLGDLYSTTLHLAEENFAKLQERARAANLPGGGGVEEYKKQAAGMYAQAVSVANEGYKELEERAKAMGVPVEEYRKMVERAVEEVRRRAVQGFEAARENVEHALNDVDAQGQDHDDDHDNEHSGKSAKASQKHNGQKKQNQQDKAHPKGKQDIQDKQDNQQKDRAPKQNAEQVVVVKAKETAPAAPVDMSDVPTTPLGGHDPLAAQAPSYAQATGEDETHEPVQPRPLSVVRNGNGNGGGSQGTQQDGKANSGSAHGQMGGTPNGARTPLGGHDPLAPHAPSYAAAAAEE